MLTGWKEKKTWVFHQCAVEIESTGSGIWLETIHSSRSNSSRGGCYLSWEARTTSWVEESEKKKTIYKTNRFHLSVRVHVRVHSDNARRTSNRGKHQSRYSLVARSVRLYSYHDLTSSVRYQGTHAQLNGLYIRISLPRSIFFLWPNFQ